MVAGLQGAQASPSRYVGRTGAPSRQAACYLLSSLDLLSSAAGYYISLSMGVVSLTNRGTTPRTIDGYFKNKLLVMYSELCNQGHSNVLDEMPKRHALFEGKIP